MKKNILLFTAIAAMGYLTLSSNSTGVGTLSGQNRTGAKTTAANCSTGGCHGSGSSTTVTITVDSAGVPVTKYTPGKSYTIKINGTNTSTLPKFGFQFAAVSGTGASQVQAGTLSSFPASVDTLVLSSLHIVEQTATLTAATPGTYSVSFQWTAATTTTLGDITMYGIINAVNGDGLANAADISGNTSVVLKMNTPAGPSAVGNMSGDMTIKAFPNPATTNLNLQLEYAPAGQYTIHVFNLGAQLIASENVVVNDATHTASINTSNWAKGTYMVYVEGEGISKLIPVAKQ